MSASNKPSPRKSTAREANQKSNGRTKRGRVIAMHAPMNELVWQATMVAVQGMTAAMRVDRDNEGQPKFSPKEFAAIAEMSHLIGLRSALRHFAWLMNDDKIETAFADLENPGEAVRLIGLSAKVGKS